jgi:2-polyprenyl-3-methyl-5-hydroxy-6-metoxy-1,4-benzoquinol methylase
MWSIGSATFLMVRAQDRCLVCGAEPAPATHGSFPFLECRLCGYGLLINDGAKQDYWSDADESDFEKHGWLGAKRRYFDSVLTLLEERVDGRHLLDIGGGIGFFAELALRRGWDAYSLDVSSTATALAGKRIGPGRALGSLTQDRNGSFDAVTLWCVIAHTKDPHELMALARRALRPGGLVWITTPNFTFQKPYAAVRAAMRRTLDFALEDHVGHFTANAVKTLLLRSGFTEPSFHYRGITERCNVTGSRQGAILGLKRAWNAAAFSLARLGFPSYMSELQLLAQRS